MTTPLVVLADLAAFALGPILAVGVIQRTRSVWAGRRGPPILQPWFDLQRLVRKTAVYGHTATAIFRVAPWVGLAAAIAGGVVVPILGVAPLLSFPLDFVWLAYAWGLGRAALMLGALDTGSAFEGMGAAREATFATLVEPALFLVFGALSLLTGQHALAGLLAVQPTSGGDVFVWGASVAALTVVVLIEGARLPADDPATHLELTMVHEVMVLDHSGPELAAIQATAALKLALGIGMLAALLNPWSGDQGAIGLALGCNLALSLGLAVAIGSMESLAARLATRDVPRYLLGAVIAGGVALLGTLWQGAA